MEEYIDLDLPSGTLWATMNVGAEGIADYGAYFSHEEALNFGVTLPTKEQFRELVENTTYKFMHSYNNTNVNGALFISKNGNELFLPASGFDTKYVVNSDVCYWSSTKYLNNDDYFCYLFAHKNNVTVTYAASCFNLPIRCVKNK